MARIRLAASAVALATVALLLLASPGQAQAPYPDCAPGAAAQPIFGSSGFPESEDGDTRLFATHPVTVAAGLGFDTFASSVTMDPPPPGLARVTEDRLATGGGLGDDFEGYSDASVVLGEEPGVYPFRVTWIQTDSEGRNPCSGAATTSITLVPPVATVRVSKPKDTGGLGGTESTVTLKLPRAGGDLRPLEVRYRAVRARRFPGAHAKERTLVVPMRVGDPGFDKNHAVTVKVGGLRAIIRPENGEALLQDFTVLFEINAKPGGSPYGYDLDVRQGGRRVTRLRVAGKCSRNGGFVSCKRKKLKRTG